MTEPRRSPGNGLVTGSGVRSARYALAVFLGILTIASAPLDVVLWWHPELDGLTAVLALLPGLSALITRQLFRRRLAEPTLFGTPAVGTWRGVGYAVMFSATVLLLAYGTAWITGLADVRIQAMPTPGVAASTGILALVTLGLVVGEETGWRGYMLPLLLRAEVPSPVLTSGLAWWAWHVPLLYAGVYLTSPHPTATAAFLLAVMLPFSAVSARLRLFTGSLWPPVALHWTWNVLVYEILNPITTGDRYGRWTGEAGALTAVCALLLTAAAQYAKCPGARRPPSERG